MAKIRVVLADDHVLVREGTRQLLEREGDIVVVGEAGDGEELLRLVECLEPDVAIVDISMPRLDGVRATVEIKKSRPRTAVLVLSAYDDNQYVVSLVEAGAAGYLLKESSGQELVQAVRRVNSGESVLHPRIARKVLEHCARRARVAEEEQSREALTERELEILRLAAEGLSNKEIAQQLFLSMRTVQAHLGNILRKLEAGSRTEAVVLAIKRGLFRLD